MPQYKTRFQNFNLEIENVVSTTCSSHIKPTLLLLLECEKRNIFKLKHPLLEKEMKRKENKKKTINIWS